MVDALVEDLLEDATAEWADFDDKTETLAEMLALADTDADTDTPAETPAFEDADLLEAFEEEDAEEVVLAFELVLALELLDEVEKSVLTKNWGRMTTAPSTRVVDATEGEAATARSARSRPSMGSARARAMASDSGPG